MVSVGVAARRRRWGSCRRLLAPRLRATDGLPGKRPVAGGISGSTSNNSCRSRITGPVKLTMQPDLAPQIAPRVTGHDRLFDGIPVMTAAGGVGAPRR